MRLNEMKLDALEKIKEMNMSASAKKQAAKYLKEADEYETKLFLMDGEIRPVNEDEKEFIDARFIREERIQEGIMDFVNQIKAQMDVVTNFIQNKGANALSAVSDKVFKPFEKIATESVAYWQKRIGNLVETLSNKLKLQDASAHLNDSLEYVHNYVGTSNPTLAAFGIGTAVIAAIGYGMLRKKKSDKEADKTVQKNLQKNDKLDKEKQKVVNEIAKAYKA